MHSLLSQSPLTPPILPTGLRCLSFCPFPKQSSLIADATHTGKLQPVVASSAIDFSHKRPVQHLVPLPSKLDFRRSLAIYFNAQAENAFFLSCGADGGVYVWDITAAVAGADNAEFLWRPVLQCQLRKQDPGNQLSLMAKHFQKASILPSRSECLHLGHKNTRVYKFKSS